MKYAELNNYFFDAKLNFNTKEKVHVVLGNEASDLDSMASSIVYAWFREKTGTKKDELHLPLINIPRRDFKLRTEAVYLFEEAGIDLSQLLFIDEVSIEEIFKSGKLKLILIDHNKLSREQEHLSPCVAEIIDHHNDEGAYPFASKTIEPVGSCATLVAERIRREGDLILDKNAALLLAGTILLDTVNLGKDAGRTTEKDEDIVAYLTTQFNIDRNRMFERLQFEKFNTALLSSYDILRKDYKDWIMNGKKTGFSSALISLENWMKKDSRLLDSVEAYFDENSLDVLFVMIAYTEPEFTRELVIFSKDEGMLRELHDHLQQNGGDLSEPKAKVPENRRAVFCHQGNTGWSRKKMQPVVQDFFAKRYR